MSDAPSLRESDGLSLNDLLVRVEGAAGPDRKLDALLCAALMAPTGSIAERATGGLWTVREPIDGRPAGHSRLLYHQTQISTYTDSVDAAFAMVERALPAANFYGVERDSGGWDAYVSRNAVNDGHWLVEVHHRPTAPLAILVALLRALAAGHGPLEGFGDGSTPQTTEAAQ